ncbi:MAG TPA: NAD(P)/FAD-dependent oxidoreductase [Euzebyales bacterium]|nr:NAD(P)/FAD-dependent oxidoreductase [Euzebyales bacterium]
MARTPQFRSLIHALQVARQRNLEAAGHPAAVVRPGTMISRRQFLMAGAAAAAATGLTVGSGGTLARAALADDALAQADARIAVVGAGLAGLTAALRLQDLGYQATLYEARDRVGGRCHSVAAGPGYVLDLGGSFVNSDHADMLHLLKRFNLQLFDRIDDAESVPYPTDAFFFGDRRIPEADVADALRLLARQITDDAALLDQNWSKWASKFDALSVTQYLDQHKDKIGAPFARTLMENAIRTEYGVEPRQSSALQLLFLLPVVDGEHVEVLGYSDERYVVEGGVGRLPRAMAAALDVPVRLGRVLTRVEDRMSTYMLTFADGEMIEVDAVIIAIPVSLLKTIDWVVTLPAQFRRYMLDVDLGRNEKTFVGYQHRLWRSPEGFVNGLWTDQGYSAAWDGTQRQDDRNDGALTFFFGGAEVAKRPDADQLVRRFDQIIEGTRPKYTGFHLATDWANEPFTRGAYVNFGPGELTTYGAYFWIENELSVAFRNLVFAGEHFSDLWYGFMNGAAETGRLAANHVVSRMGGRV